jgi:uncharacterized protein YmfQ (DUF2313 family)
MDTLNALLSSLPPVAYDPQAVTVRDEFRAVATPLERVLQQAAQLRVESDPATAQLGLPDWERVYGLPDPCAGLSSSIERRRADVVSKVNTVSNLAAAQMVALATSLGYTGAQVVEFEMSGCASACNAEVYGPETWRFVWALRVNDTLLVEQANCGSPCDVAMARWGNEPLFCAIQRYKPAHTYGLILFGNEVL